MGSIGSTLFGSPSQQSQSSNSSSVGGNAAYGTVNAGLNPVMGNAGAASSMMGALLGIPSYSSGAPLPTFQGPTSTQAAGVGSGGGGHMVDLFHDGINGNGKAAQKAGQPTSYWVNDLGQMGHQSTSGYSSGVPQAIAGLSHPGDSAPTTVADPAGAAPAGTPGVTGQTAQSALQNFSDSAGMKFLEDNGNRMINSNQAAKGLLNSGSTLTGIADYSNGLHQQYLNNYMQNLQNFGNMGINAGNAISGAGNYNSANSTSSGSGTGAKDGIAGTLISAASKIPGISDRRLKTDVEKVGEYSDGLGRYRWTFVDGHGLPTGRQEGVMADEVKELRPWAHIPNMMGEFDGVDYGRL